jgi:Predicted membrane protein (DUF2142)
MQHRLAGLRPRTQWLVSFLLFALLSGCWSLASPLFSGPDEPAHVVDAAAVVRGQLLPPLHGALARMRVPAILGNANAMPACYMFRSDIAADCTGRLGGSTAETTVETPAARYPPLYYAIVGLPTRPFPSEAGVRLMRLISLLLCAGFLAGAVSAATSVRGSRWLVVGVAVAVTPMALFLAGIVNPNSVEIAAAICLWACGLALAGRPARGAVPALAAGASGSACALVLTRALSPLWLGCIGATLFVVAGWAQGASLFRRLDVRRWAVVVAVATVVAVAWIRLAGASHVDTSVVRYPTSQAAALRASLDSTDWKLRQMVGVFGWLDTSASTLTYYLWFFVVGMLLLTGLAMAGWRVRLTLGVLFVLVVVLPVILELQVVHYLGPIWQGRYTMPIAVGIPLIAAYAVARPVDWGPDRGSAPPTGATASSHYPLPVALAPVVIGTLAIAHIVAFLWALRRYTVGGGLHHKLDLFSGRWQPPLTAAGLCALFVVVVVLYAGWLNYLLSHRAGAVPHTVDALSGAPR